MKTIKLLFSIFIFLFLITSFSILIIANLEKNTETEKIKTDYKITKFEIQEKPSKTIPYEQKTDSRRYIKHLYEYLDKIEKARDKPIRK